jgi:uncharacterized membrane protein YqjE
MAGTQAPPQTPASVQAEAAHAAAAGDAAATARGTGSLIDLARAVLHDLPGLIGDRVELFSLEMHRAGIALVKALAMTVVATVLGVTAWLAMWSIVVGLLVGAGWHWAAANGLAVLIDLFAVAWAVRRVRALIKLFALPATRQHLALGTGSSTAATPTAPTDEQPAVHQRAAA